MQAYLVLARKYRPRNFRDLKGQDHLVCTFKNSIKNNRIAHAYLLVGIRGVGKTTSARIIAKALNCLGEGNDQNMPQTEPCNKCYNCTLITQDRHPDVFEMDAASNTGVDDIRKIIDEVQYKPLHARYKVIIIDEVHMLSTNAFNALLKTLEEPPEHIIFIFATTEFRKIPVTTVSRCQKFDLKRLTNIEIQQYLSHIASLEKVVLEEGAKKIIASYSEGSVRDALSMLDQAINIADIDNITDKLVNEMLGITNHDIIIQLYTNIVNADIINSIDLLRECYFKGNDPIQIIHDILDLTHELCIIKSTNYSMITDHSDNLNFLEIAKKISLSTVMRIWQIISNNINEIKLSSSSIAASEMLIVKIIYASLLPSFDDIIENIEKKIKIGNNNEKNIKINDCDSDEPIADENSLFVAEQFLNSKCDISTQNVENLIENISNFEDVIHLCEKYDQPILRYHLYNDVHCVRFMPNCLELSFKERAPKEIEKMIKALLLKYTKIEWKIIKSTISGNSYSENVNKDFKERKEIAYNDPLVNSIMHHFPGSEIIKC